MCKSAGADHDGMAQALAAIHAWGCFVELLGSTLLETQPDFLNAMFQVQ